MARNLSYSYFLLSLQKSLELNSVTVFQKNLSSLKTSGTPIELALPYIIQARAQWNFTDQETFDKLNYKIKNEKANELEVLINYLRFSALTDPILTPYILKSLEEHIKYLHPFEITQSQMIHILSSLNNTGYYNKEILDFINTSILQSNLPPGRLGQELLCQLIKFYSNTGIECIEIWDLLKTILNSKNYHQPSIENKISIVHSLCLKDNFSIPQNILNDFFQIPFQRLQSPKILEVLLVFNYLEFFKNVKNFSRSAEEFRKNPEILDIKPATITSNFQKEIGRVFKFCFNDFQSEYIIRENNSFMTVDIFLPPKLIVEAQGPSHYLKPQNRELEKSKKKRAYLESIGYSVYSIPYFDWPSTHSSQVTYIKSLIP